MKLNYASGPDSGPPLVLLHGVTRRWQSFLPVMPGLGSRWRVYALDLPGHGGSDRLDRYRVVDYVPAVLEFLRKRVRQPAVIYGHSLGSMLAAAIAAEAPELVRAVVLEDPPFETMGERLRSGPLHAYFEALLPFAGSRIQVPELARQLGEACADGIPLKQLRDAVALRFTAASLRRLDPAVLKPVIAGEWLVGYDRDPVLRAVRCPALLLQADPAAGGMLTDQDAVDAAGMIADCVSLRVASAPHLIHWADAPNLLRFVHGFLASLE